MNENLSNYSIQTETLYVRAGAPHIQGAAAVWASVHHPCQTRLAGRISKSRQIIDNCAILSLVFG